MSWSCCAIHKPSRNDTLLRAAGLATRRRSFGRAALPVDGAAHPRSRCSRPARPSSVELTLQPDGVLLVRGQADEDWIADARLLGRQSPACRPLSAR